MRWLLDASAAALVLGIGLALAYEAIAFFSGGRIPLISDIVIPWVHLHLWLATLIAAICVGAVAWFLIHFFIR